MKKTSILVLLLAAFSCTADLVKGQACGNGAQAGPSAPPSSGPAGSGAGDPFDSYTGNDSRHVPDLTLFGGVGQHRLSFDRYTSSRYIGTTQPFGAGSSIRHSYQWDMADYGSGELQIIYPDGTQYIFKQVSPTEWNSTDACPDILFQSGTNYTLQRQNGWQYNFATIYSGSSHYYQMQNFVDSAQNVYNLTYDSSNRVTKVTEPAGRYLSVNYGTASVQSASTIAITKVTTTPSPGSYVTVSLAYAGTYRYLYISPKQGSSGTINPVEIAEIQFLDSHGNVISGTPFGSPGSSPSTGPAQAFDGNPATYAESADIVQPYVGLDLGSGTTTKATSVRILARSGYETDLLNAYINASNVSPTTVPVIASVAASDGRSVSYNYSSVANVGLPYSYAVLSGVSYPDGTAASYNYTQTQHDTRPVASDIADPRYPLPFTQIHNDYYTSVTGEIADQVAPGGAVVTSLSSSDAHHPIVTALSAAGTPVTMNLAFGNGVLGIRYDYLGRRSDYGHATSNNDGFLTSVRDPLLHTTTISPSVHGNPLAVTHPDGTSWSVSRDSLDLPTAYTNENGKTTSYTRDSSHRVVGVALPDATSESFAYNSFGQVTSHTLRNGASESATYDSAGRLQTRTDAVGNTTTVSSYDSLDRPTSVTDANGHTTQYAYNDRGQVTLITYADGSTYSYTYDSYGNKTSETNEIGQTWTYTYDVFKRLTSKTDPLSRTTSYTYGGNYQNKPLSVTLPSGKVTTYVYDAMWQMTSKTVGYGTADAATTHYTYDGAGNLLTQTDPNGHVWSYTYDNRNRKLTATDPLGHVTTWTYDNASNILTVKRPDGGVTTNTYDSMNRLLTTKDPKGETTTYTYDVSGNMLTVTDPNGNTYTYTYDHLNRKTSLTYPDGSVESYGYDPVGNMTTYTTRAGQTKTSVFDNRNREVSYTWSDSTPGVTRTYDAAGRLLTSANSSSTSTYTYDNANQLLSETEANASSGFSWTVAYTYDADGNKASTTYPSGTAVGYGRTNRNQVNSITVGGTTLASYTYDGNGNTLTKNLADGTLASYTYDVANNLTTLNHTLSGTSFARFDYGYNTLNDRKYEQRNSSKGDVYTYDADRQVSGVQYDATNPSGTPSSPDRTVGYTYDSNGNRTLVSDSVNGNTSYAANNLNQYTSLNGTAYGYDGNGNLTTGNGLYLYDSQNRLTYAQVGSNTDQYSYDSKNRVVARTVNGTTTYYVYDGWDLIEERDGSNNVLATYVHGVKQDELLSKTTPANTVYYHHNALGSVINLTNTSGAVIEQYKYDAFGKPTITDGSGNPLTATAYGNRFLFTGREYLAEVNLYDYRNRVYSADLGRFLQTDPLRFSAGDINIYRYVGNNPLNLTDAMGLCDDDSNDPNDDSNPFPPYYPFGPNGPSFDFGQIPTGPSTGPTPPNGNGPVYGGSQPPSSPTYVGGSITITF